MPPNWIDLAFRDSTHPRQRCHTASIEFTWANGGLVIQTVEGNEPAGNESAGNEPAGSGAGDGALLTVVFAPGQRPDIGVLRELAAAPDAMPRFSLSHVPPAEQGWAELLAMGLTFDCTGLAPAAAAAMPSEGALLGLERAPQGEAIGLAPGPHLADAAGMVPVLRILAGIGARLAQLPGVQAVCWNRARCWMPAEYFCKVVGSWLAGGPFPALGLTSLEREGDGAIVSVGLDLLIGQELQFATTEKFAAPDIARIAVRLIHALIDTGPLVGPHDFIGPDGITLQVQPVAHGRRLNVSVRK